MRKWGLLIILFLAATTTVVAQTKSLEKADQLFAQTAYPEAIDAYQKAVEDAPTNAHALTRLADCYRLTDDFRNALRAYARAVKLKNVDAEAWFHYGEVLMINRKYEEAIPWLEKYQKAVPNDDRVTDMIASCQNQQKFTASKSLFILRRLAVNSESSDFGPSFFGKSVVFASDRKRSMFKAERTGDSYLDLYIADYNGKPELGEPVLFRGATNTPVHEALACFSKNGKEMYFTRNNIQKGATKGGEDIVQLALYKSVLVDEKWSKGELLPFNNEGYSCGHPTLSADEQHLFFVSNMPGGFGRTDLYMVSKTGEAWGNPENLGQDINSKGDEMFPWIDGSGQLYFASNGRGGMGGLDIFQVDPNSEIIGDPTNLGAPVNSSYDDFGFICDAQSGIGFITSNRLGGKGDDDLYALIKLIRWEGKVVDSAGIAMMDVLVDLREGRSQTQTTTDERGCFWLGLRPQAAYVLYLKAPGYKDLRIEFKADSKLDSGKWTMEKVD